MAESVTYSLQLRNEKGELATGSLKLFAENVLAAGASIAKKMVRPTLDEQIIKIGITKIAALLEAKAITGQPAYTLNGSMFSDADYGPPIQTVLTGCVSSSDVSMSYNLIDSPGHYIGGALVWRPNGPTGVSVPWTFLGTVSE